MIARPIVHNLHEALLKISPEPYAKSCSSTGRSSRPPLHLRQPRTRQEVDRKREQNRYGRSPTRKAARRSTSSSGSGPDSGRPRWPNWPITNTKFRQGKSKMEIKTFRIQAQGWSDVKCFEAAPSTHQEILFNLRSSGYQKF